MKNKACEHFSCKNQWISLKVIPACKIMYQHISVIATYIEILGTVVGAKMESELYLCTL